METTALKHKNMSLLLRTATVAALVIAMPLNVEAKNKENCNHFDGVTKISQGVFKLNFSSKGLWGTVISYQDENKNCHSHLDIEGYPNVFTRSDIKKLGSYIKRTERACKMDIAKR